MSHVNALTAYQISMFINHTLKLILVHKNNIISKFSWNEVISNVEPEADPTKCNQKAAAGYRACLHPPTSCHCCAVICIAVAVKG